MAQNNLTCFQLVPKRVFCTLSCLWHTYQTELTISEVQTRTRTLQFHVTLGTAEWSIPSRGGHLTIRGIHLDKAKHAEAKQHIGVSWSQVPSLQILVKKIVTFTGISKFKGTGCKPYRISRKDSAGAIAWEDLGRTSNKLSAIESQGTQDSLTCGLLGFSLDANLSQISRPL